MNDLVRELGSLALASRLRRLSDRLHRDLSRVYREKRLDMEARWFPIMYLLQDGQSASVTEIGHRIGMSHPAVNQIAGSMTRVGLLISETDGEDQRRRLLSLSPRGHEMVKQLRPVWADLQLHVDELLQETDQSLIDVLDRVERSLDQQELSDRVLSAQDENRSSGQTG